MDYRIIRLVDGNQKEEWLTKFKLTVKSGDYRVVGKTTRYLSDGKEITGEPRLFKFCEKGKHGILLLVKNVPEKFIYNYKMEREKAWQGCMELMSANTANPKKLLTIITSFLEETNGLQKPSTSPKTTKDSAVSAIPTGLSTLSPTELLYGKENAKSTGKGICWRGSKVFPSKNGLTFWAKVNTSGCMSYLSREMQRNNGKVILCKVEGDAYKHGDFYYYPDILEPMVKPAVINIKDDKMVTTNNHNDSANNSMKRSNGKIKWFKASYKEGDWWKPLTGDSWNYHESWLDFDVKEVNDDDLESRRTQNSLPFEW